MGAYPFDEPYKDARDVSRVGTEELIRSLTRRTTSAFFTLHVMAILTRKR
jgi:hypothetical protein